MSEISAARTWGQDWAAHVGGLGLAAIAFAILPKPFFSHFFDRNAAPQFLALLIVAGLLSITALFKNSLTFRSPVLGVMIAALAVSTSISLFFSHNIVGGIIGDAGRYNGVASLIALVLIAFYFSHLTVGEISVALDWIAVICVGVTLIGLAQWWKWISLPGDSGIGSTLGNIDFLSAWIGTTIVIVVLHPRRFHLMHVAKTIYCILAFYLLWRIGAKQGIIDIALIAIACVIWRFRRLLRFNQLTPRFWTVSLCALFLLWCEFIYLVPMAQIPVPGINHDPNIRIRTDFWFSGMNMLFHHLFFGVGPDNYGYYYEKYRSLSSVKMTETVVSNDAHSAMVQTLGTMGVIGTLAFTALIFYFIYSLVFSFYRHENERPLYLAFGLFAAIYLTNSLESPMTLPNKAIFWALCGWVIGRNIWRNSEAQMKKFSWTKTMVGVLAASLLITASSFGWALFNFASAQDGATSGKKPSYSYSTLLPCTLYFAPQFNYAVASGSNSEELGKRVLSTNSRCVDAQATLVTILFQQRKYQEAKPYIYSLLDTAPGRRGVVRLAAIYALQTHDVTLEKALVKQGFNLGILVTSG